MMALDVGLRASVVVLVALVASVALRRRSAAFRHWVLAVGILAAAAVAPLSVEQVVIPIWAAGFAISAVLMLLGCLRLRRLTSTSTPVGDGRFLALAREIGASLGVGSEVRLLQTGQPGMLGTWGWRRPCVLLPAHCETWSDERIRIVLGHELAHIRRADGAIQMSVDLVRAAFWYNPLFWIACARLRREGEAACDDAVLEAGVPAADYALHLLAIARACRTPARPAALVPMARRSTLAWRIAAMLNHTQVGSKLPGFMSLAQDVRLENPRHWELSLTIPVGAIQETIRVTERRGLDECVGRVQS